MDHLLKMLMLLSLLILATACGGDNDDDDDDVVQTPPRQEENAPFPPESFVTRLADKLELRGNKCVGGEVLDSSNPNAKKCEPGQFLIEVDDANICSEILGDNEACTEIGVDPFIAKMVQANINLGDFSYYRIDPESPTTAPQRSILSNIFVRTAPNGETEVVKADDVR